jgi:hypothetical protein
MGTAGVPVIAQPFFDAAALSMWRIPASETKNAASETEGNVFVAVPVKLGPRNTFIVSPFYETKYLDDRELPATVHLHHSALSATWRHQFADTAWTVTAVGIARAVSTQFRFNGDVFQVAGALLGSYRVNSSLVLKGGLYYSREFFGDYFMLLAGIEWDISERLKLFGLVNTSVKLEYRFSDRVYGGAVTRNITNSYRVKGHGGYYKFSDNHIGLFTDVCFGKRVVWSVEAGHTAFRYVKAREGAGFPEQDEDGPVFKTGIYYRVRLR